MREAVAREGSTAWEEGAVGWDKSKPPSQDHFPPGWTGEMGVYLPAAPEPLVDLQLPAQSPLCCSQCRHRTPPQTPHSGAESWEVCPHPHEVAPWKYHDRPGFPSLPPPPHPIMQSCYNAADVILVWMASDRNDNAGENIQNSGSYDCSGSPRKKNT